MRRVKVRKLDLINKVRTNRETHVTEYKEACAGYREQALEKLEEAADRLKRQLSALKEGEAIGLAAIHFSLPLPENHAADYDQVLAMLEMSVDEEIELDDDSFAKYVMDNWDWRDKWEATKMSYNNRR